ELRRRTGAWGGATSRRIPSIESPDPRDTRAVARARSRKREAARRVPAIAELDRRHEARQRALRAATALARPWLNVCARAHVSRAGSAVSGTGNGRSGALAVRNDPSVSGRQWSYWAAADTAVAA